MPEPKALVKNLNRPGPSYQDRSTIYRFDKNERATLFTDIEFKAMLATLEPLDFVGYGELEPFYAKIQSRLGVNRDQILLASGSDTSIRSVYETYVEPGDEVAILVPTYAMFSAYAKLFGAKEIPWTYNPDFSVDIDRCISTLTGKTKLVAIANPNHTGTVLPESDLVKIIKAAHRVDALVIIDEAYHHFYPETLLPFIRQYDNLIIIRTFSKALGLASLRIGLIISSPQIIANLYHIKLVHEITGTAAKIGGYLLDHMEIVENFVNDVNRAKDVLYRELPPLGFEVLKSEANFVFFKAPAGVDATRLLKELGSKKMFIKGPFNNTPFTGHLRTTVGDAAQMILLVQEIRNILTPALA